VKKKCPEGSKAKNLTATRCTQTATETVGVKCYIQNQTLTSQRSRDFENTVWKSAETVAFGVKSPWVVAWYCSNTFPTTLQARKASDRKANVLQTQIVNGFNAAYNKLALNSHNLKRSKHQNTPPFKEPYAAAAKEIQKIMDEDSFSGRMPAEGARPA